MQDGTYSADGTFEPNQNKVGFYRHIYLRPSFFLPIALKILQNLRDEAPILHGLLLPTLILLAEEGSSKNRYYQLFITNPLKHHYFGSFLHHEMIAHNINPHIASAAIEVLVRYLDLKYYDDKAQYISMQNSALLLISGANQGLVYLGLDTIFGNNCIAKFSLRTATCLCILLATDKNALNSKRAVLEHLKKAVYMQALSSFAPVSETTSLHSDFKEIIGSTAEVVNAYCTPYHAA